MNNKETAEEHLIRVFNAAREELNATARRLLPYSAEGKDAEDIVQEAFLLVLGKVRAQAQGGHQGTKFEIRSESKTRAYLAFCVKTKMKDAIKHKRRRDEYRGGTPISLNDPATIGLARTQGDVVSRQAVGEALGSLSHAERTVLFGRFLNRPKEPLKQLATELKLPVKEIKNLRDQAIEKMLNALGRDAA